MKTETQLDKSAVRVKERRSFTLTFENLSRKLLFIKQGSWQRAMIPFLAAPLRACIPSQPAATTG